MNNEYQRKFQQAEIDLRDRYLSDKELLKKQLDESREQRAVRDAENERGPHPRPPGHDLGDASIAPLVEKHRTKWAQLDEQRLNEVDAKRDDALGRLAAEYATDRGRNFTAQELATDAAMVPKDHDRNRPPKHNLSTIEGRNGNRFVGEFEEQARAPEGFRPVSGNPVPPPPEISMDPSRPPIIPEGGTPQANTQREAYERKMEELRQRDLEKAQERERERSREIGRDDR